MNGNNQLKVFSGRANMPLAERIAQCLGDPLGRPAQDWPEGGPAPGGMDRISPLDVLARIAPYLDRRQAEK